MHAEWALRAQVLELLRDAPDGAPVRIRVSRGAKPEGVTLTELSDAGRPLHLSLQEPPGAAAAAADEDVTASSAANGNGPAAGNGAGNGATASSNGE